MGPLLAGNVGTGSAFALTREGDQGVDVPMLATDPSRSASVLFVGDGAYARREALKDLPLRCAQVFFGVRFQSSLRPHPAPPAYLLLGMGPALAGNVGRGLGFRAERARGAGCRRSYARSGPIPLRLRTFCWGWGLRSQGSSEGSTIALRAGFLGVRFQSSLRPHPAPPAQNAAGSMAQPRSRPSSRQGSQARFPGKVDGPGRLSAARNFRQGQGGSGCVYPLRYSPPDPTQ